MLSGTRSWRTDRHTLPVTALFKRSCNCNELQSGLFGMLLIFDANIWGEQAFWRTERNDNPNFSHSHCDLTPRCFPYSLANFQFALCLCVCLNHLLSALWLQFYSGSSCFSASHPLCSTESNGDWPSPTGLRWRPTLRRWSVSPTYSTLSLSPSV